MFVQQHCFQQSIHQMMTLDSGMVSGAEASLPLAQSTPAVTHDTTKLCWIVITQWNCHINADAVKALTWIFFYVCPLVWWRKSKISQEYGGSVGKETSASNLNRKHIGYPTISDTLFSQILVFFQHTWMCPSYIVSCKVGDLSWGWPEGSLFNSYHTEMWRRVILLSLDCSTSLDPYLIMLSVKQGGIKYHFFCVFGMTRPGTEPWSPGPLVNTLLNHYYYYYYRHYVSVCH